MTQDIETTAPALPDTDTAADMLAALGKPQRLEIFRRLVRAGPEGLTVGAIGEALGMPAATLAHHLGTLVRAGLVAQGREGRIVRCRPVFERFDAMVAFLTDECCADRNADCHRVADAHGRIDVPEEAAE